MTSGPTAADRPGRRPLPPPGRALVLNATFEPLGIVSSKRAVLLVLDTKAELVHVTDRVFRSERFSVPEPSVVRLVRYVQIPRHYRVAVNRRTVFARDGSRCQYCGSAAENLDHVIPRSRGGSTRGRTWSPPAAGATPARRTASHTRWGCCCARHRWLPDTGSSSWPFVAGPATTGTPTSVWPRPRRQRPPTSGA